MMIKQFGSKLQYTKTWSDDDIQESDSDEIDSEVEFHLYSQIHYSTDDFSSAHKESAGVEQNFKQGLLSNDDENCPSSRKDDFPLVDQELEDSEPSRNAHYFSKEDIVMLNVANDADDFVPESWEIVDSITDEDSDDPGVDVHVSQQQEDEDDQERNEAWIPGKGPKECWKINVKDKIKLDGKNRYYSAETGGGGSRMRCRNCENTGHKAKDCPEGKTLPVCFMCGNRGHIGRDCSERRNHNFAYRHVECNRCGQEGHMRVDCPDLWRQFHVTTEPGPINEPRIPIKLNNNVQCYNCAGDGHFGHECEEQRYQSYCPILKPFVHRYDRHVVAEVSKDLRKKLKAKHRAQDDRTTHHEPHKGRTKAKRLNTLIVFRTPSPPIYKKHRESQGRKRKNVLDSTLQYQAKKHRPENTRKQRYDCVGESRKRKERYNSSDSYHHASQRFDERVVSINQRKHHFQSSKKKQTFDRKVTYKQEYHVHEQSSRGFKRCHF